MAMKRSLLILYWLSFTLALGVTGMLIRCGGGSGTSTTSSLPGGSGTITEQIVVVGQTSSTNFPTSNAAQSANMGNGDGFVASGQLTTTTASVFGFSTYLGGSDSEQVRDVFVDDQGSVYVTGWTKSPNLPTTSGVFQPGYRGGQDAFVAKFSASGQLVFLTYLGGSGDEVAYGISVDAAGFIYLNGRTSSADFPVTQGAFQTTIGGGADAFVTKMKPDGSGLVWSTFVGGSNDDQGRGRNVVDSTGAVYVNGATTSTNFPTQNAIQTSLKGSADGFVLKLSPDGSRLLYSTYLGGTDTDGLDALISGLAVNSNGEAFVCGFTSAANFPTTPGAFQPALKGTTNGTIIRLSASGQLLASTLLGGSGSSFQSCEGLTLDSAGNPVAMGLTGAPDFPTTAGVFQTALQGQLDMWIAKLTPDLSRVVFSTYVGTSGSEVVDTSRVELDASGNIWFALNTDSAGFPVTPNALQATYGGGTHDAVVVKLAADGSRILYATYLGGSADDFARSFRYKKR